MQGMESFRLWKDVIVVEREWMVVGCCRCSSAVVLQRSSGRHNSSSPQIRQQQPIEGRKDTLAPYPFFIAARLLQVYFHISTRISVINTNFRKKP